MKVLAAGEYEIQRISNLKQTNESKLNIKGGLY
jgi:hypothetical protein